MCDWDNPLFRKRRRKPTAAEVLARENMSPDRRTALDRLAGLVPDPCPYVSLRGPGGEPGVEIGLKGSF